MYNESGTKRQSKQHLRGDNMAMSEAARRARSEYKKAWNQKNREKIRAYNEVYWERKAAAMAAEEKKAAEE